MTTVADVVEDLNRLDDEHELDAAAVVAFVGGEPVVEWAGDEEDVTEPYLAGALVVALARSHELAIVDVLSATSKAAREIDDRVEFAAIDEREGGS